MTLLAQRPTDSGAQQAEALFKEARQRRRRRLVRLGVGALVVLSALVALLRLVQRHPGEAGEASAPACADPSQGGQSEFGGR